MRTKMTCYLDVTSSCCFWAEPAWAELKRRYADRVGFGWKIRDPKSETDPSLVTAAAAKG